MSAITWVSNLASPYGCVTDGIYLYITDLIDNGGYGVNITRIELANASSISYLIYGGNSFIGPLAIDTTYLYSSSIENSVQPIITLMVISTMSTNGTTLSFNQDSGGNYPSEVTGLVVVGDYLYCSHGTSGVISRFYIPDIIIGQSSNVNQAGFGGDTYGYNNLGGLLTSGSPNGLATDNTYLYIACTGSNEIVRMNLSTLQGESYLELNYVYGLCVSSDLYSLYAVTTDNTLLQIEISSGNTGVILSTGLNNPRALTSSGNYFYITNYATGGFSPNLNDGYITRYGSSSPSSDTSLTTFTVNGTPVTGGETITVLYGTTSIPVVVVTTSSAAYISVDLNEGIPSTGTGSVSDTFGDLTTGLPNNEVHVNVLAEDGVTSQQYIVYVYRNGPPSVACFGENTKILCFNREKSEEEYVLIQNIRKGTLVKTLLNGYVPVHMIGKRKIQSFANNERIKNRLYKCSKKNYPEMIDDEDLILTGCHSILVKYLTDGQRQQTIEELKQIYVTDKRYRLLTFLDPRAEVYQVKGEFPIYHFALENDNYYMNYGVYANGLLVESCTKNYLERLSNMTIIG
jgi:hypothetical protein